MAASLVIKSARLFCRLSTQSCLSLRRCFANQSQGATQSFTSYTKRTHLCGELRASHVNTRVTLCGWLQYHRLSGAFIILRDWRGIVQLILPPDKVDEMRDSSLETVLEVEGEVKLRPSGQENKKMPTGEIEVHVDSIKVLNNCKPTLPFEIRNFNEVNEPLRIKHRYLDLRVRNLQSNLRLRSKFVMAMRKFLADKHGFVEVETPTLFRRTPGGAREFIVPTHAPGEFYTLPQSPQQFKQLLMVGGLDRYFQVARCYRDETTRADRQPEFTQVDLEMSFVTQDEVKSLIENMLKTSWPEEKGEISTPFPHMSYADAMSLYGVDKPDLRFDWQIQDVTDIIQDKCPPVFLPTLQTEPSSIQAIRIPGAAKHVSNKEVEGIKESAGSSGKDTVILVSTKVKAEDQWTSGVGPQLSLDQKRRLSDALGTVQEGDLILLASGLNFNPHKVLGETRIKFANSLEAKGVTVRRPGFYFLWVDDFPLFLPREDGEDGLESAHHPFTAPHPDDEALLFSAPEQVRSQHYDLVLNGHEIGGGSIRLHNSATQRHVLTQILKEDTSELEHLLEALDCGCPPHGGIALGLDRLMAILCEASSIRDVIAFPKISKGRDPLSNAPAPVTQAQLDYYRIRMTRGGADGDTDVDVD